MAPKPANAYAGWPISALAGSSQASDRIRPTGVPRDPGAKSAH
jgi:hypothetical protein